MALTLAQRDVLSTNSDFLSRVRGAVARQAQYYLDLGGSATQVQRDWAANVFWAGQRLAQVAANMGPQLANHTTIFAATQPDASDISDEVLLGVVGSICDSYN